VFINDDFYGNDITEIQINNGDIVRVVITKLDNTQPSEIIFNEELI
jgi:translation initiation factor IF-1